jgi:AIR synthase-related protein
VTVAPIAAKLRSSAALRHKTAIQIAAHHLDRAPVFGGDRVRIGDDTAAIPDGDGYLLFAAEGMIPAFVDRDPYFAGWSAIMVNVSDVASMGGVPLAVVDVYWRNDAAKADLVFAGMRAASEAYAVPIVGGHTSRQPAGIHALAVAIVGRARSLLTSFGARPGQVVLAAIDMRGQWYGDYPFWNAATQAPPERLRADLAVLPALAATGRVRACKDISMGGIAGTLLMLLEASSCGAVLDLGRIPMPEGAIDKARWIEAFPSFGYLLSVEPEDAPLVCAAFAARQIACAPIATLDDTRTLRIAADGVTEEVWDLRQAPLTGFTGEGAPAPRVRPDV